MKIHFAESQYDKKIAPDFKKRYKQEIEKAYGEVTKLLPFGSQRINFFIQPRTFDLIEETGDMARAMNSEYLELAFDPTRNKKGLEAILDGVKYSVYHEMNHAARFSIPIWHKSYLDKCVLEGLATVFTREYTDEKAGWAIYPKNVAEWLVEIIDKNGQLNWDHYTYTHPDGRRWIGYKVGTYIIDQATKKSGKTIIELTKMECKDILELANVKQK